MKVKYFAGYRDITKRKEEDVTAPKDIWGLMLMLCDSYGKAMKDEMLSTDGLEITKDIVILLNGRNICHLDGKNTALAEHDVVSIFPVVAGG
jgi:molybdopterin synthase sulfur carrier subunit